MPHVIVKLWPGKSEQQKVRLAEASSRFLRKFSPWNWGALRRKSSAGRSSMVLKRPVRKPRPSGL